MDYSLKEVAGRIKDLREAKGYTPEELAKLTGVSVDDYTVLEKGETDFSFTFIYMNIIRITLIERISLV